MTKLEILANSLTSPASVSYHRANGLQKIEILKQFTTLPAVVTETKTQSVKSLNKDQKIGLLMAALNPAATEGEKMNAAALTSNDESAKVTFSETLGYNDALNSWGALRVAAAIFDGLDAATIEKISTTRKFDLPAELDINAIPAFIEALQAIYNENAAAAGVTKKAAKTA